MSRFDDYRRTGHSPVRLRTGRRRPRDPSTQCAATAERIPSSGPPRAIADFREQHREVASTLTQADPEEAMTRLRAGTVDLIITADAKEGVHGDIEVVHLMDDPTLRGPSRGSPAGDPRRDPPGRAGVGVALIPVLGLSTKPDGIATVPIAGEAVVRHVNAALHAANYRSPAAGAMLGCLRAVADARAASSPAA